MDRDTLIATKALVGRCPALPPSQPLTTRANGKNESSIVVRDDQRKIVGYYDPPTLTEEYEAPVLIQISHHTGVPIVHGKPFWERLPNEDIDLYDLFSHFRDQDAPRLLQHTAENFNVEPEVVEVVSQLWAWPERVETYDGYASLLAEKERARRIVVMEGTQTKVARKLFQQAQEILDSFTPGDYTPAQAVTLLKEAVALERLANKLPREEPMEVYDKKNQKGDPKINLSGEGQKVQINFTKDWNPG